MSIAYDTNYLERTESSPQLKEWEEQIKVLDFQIANFKNIIYGLEEEEKVITTNRMVTTDNMALSLDKVKEISQYYRERLTAIKNEIFKNKLEMDILSEQKKAIGLQMAEVNNAPEQEQGEITIIFDVSTAITLPLRLNYMVKDAGWVPNYDIKSKSLNAPINLAYKANVYQNTGKDWKDVAVVLSTGNPDYNISKPKLDAHYLNFTSAYSQKYSAVQKNRDMLLIQQ